MNEFQQVIKAYLDQRAQEDAKFADNYAKQGKSIEKCCNYIFRQAKKRGDVNGDGRINITDITLLVSAI
jgi:predicted lipoprotein with Yx(FWY)xxD motif